MPDEPRSLRVEEAQRGRRLDLFLAECLGLSRAQARRLLARGAVRLDGRVAGEAAKGLALEPGSLLEVEPFRPPGQQRVEPEPGARLRVLARGPGWLAVDKPAGTPVHPLREGERGTLLAAVAALHPEIQGVGEGGLRSGVVHRLDVDTSGVVLFASTEPVWRRLRAAFAEHRVEKVYRALVRGRLREPGRATLPLALARHRPARVRVVTGRERRRARGVRQAVMSWRPLETFDDATLVEVRPLTGFLHQIRVVLAHHGHPLLGDVAYGGDTSEAPRHMLHASRVAFEEVVAESPDPEDLAALCRRLRAAGEAPRAG